MCRACTHSLQGISPAGGQGAALPVGLPRMQGSGAAATLGPRRRRASSRARWEPIEWRAECGRGWPRLRGGRHVTGRRRPPGDDARLHRPAAIPLTRLLPPHARTRARCRARSRRVHAAFDTSASREGGQLFIVVTQRRPLAPVCLLYNRLYDMRAR